MALRRSIDAGPHSAFVHSDAGRLERTNMRSFWAICIVLLCLAAKPSGQVLPSSRGGCSISPTGLMDCDILSPAPMSPGRKVFYSKPEFHVIRYQLAPGAPLKKNLEHYDNLIVSLSEG